MDTYIKKSDIVSVLERSRYISDALASVRMMEGVVVDRGNWIPCSEKLPEEIDYFNKEE